MEESIRRAFGLEAAKLKELPTLSLAYAGDAVFELVMRTLVLERDGGLNGALHKHALPYVSAVGQARLADAVQGLLTEEEAAVYRRGRNAKPEHGAKNASAQEYHKATGLEALIGWLYLQGKTERAIELIREGLPDGGKKQD